MRYCRRCILPDSRPGLEIGPDGVCNGCQGAEEKKTTIDWEARRAAFLAVVENAKTRSQGYDCLIPVSGGKDSTWQVVTCLEHGLTPLAVTWRPPGRTALGQRNLDNLVRLGVDHIDYQINPQIERRFMLRALERYGSTAVPMHLALFGIPLTLAVRFRIPLVMWGENSALEYGGTADERRGFRLDAAWLKKYGVTHGTTADDWVSEDLPARALTAYRGPTDQEMEENGVLAVFLGYYFPWDAETSYRVAARYGFEARTEGPRTGYWNYADLDDDFISIHHFLKWYKFGITRTWDNLAAEIRAGRMTRDQAIALLRTRGDETPREDIAKFCQFAEIPEARFWEIIEPFRNRKIWEKTGDRWTIPGFLIPDWSWS
ncbi:MAG: N-acetyl sugar amidotransferase [Armatimonadetes bacterium]|nr:N-acetyl sugar amidotransferase [Armatimonadota bacterium]